MATSRGDHLRLATGELIKGRYEVIEEVGCGNFSKVYRCNDKKAVVDGKERRRAPVAMKVLKKEYRNDAAFERRMLKILQEKDTMRSARVCKMIDYFDWQDCPVFIMPIHGPSVRSRRLGIDRGVVTRPLLVSFAYDLLETLSFVHFTCRMVHTDLKPENILIADTVSPSDRTLGNRWVICDFGSASLWRMERLDSDLISTRPYRAPEVVLGNKWFYAADMWSMGCILYEVAVGHRLFEVRDDNTHLQLMERRVGRLPDAMRKHSKYSPRFFTPKGDFLITSETIRSGRCRLTHIADMFRSDPEFLHLLQGMLVYEPTKRMTADRALGDPIFDDIRRRCQGTPLAVDTGAEGIKATETGNTVVQDVPILTTSSGQWAGMQSGDGLRQHPMQSGGDTALSVNLSTDFSGVQSSTCTDDQPSRKLGAFYADPNSGTSPSASSLSPPPPASVKEAASSPMPQPATGAATTAITATKSLLHMSSPAPSPTSRPRCGGPDSHLVESCTSSPLVTPSPAAPPRAPGAIAAAAEAKAASRKREAAAPPSSMSAGAASGGPRENAGPATSTVASNRTLSSSYYRTAKPGLSASKATRPAARSLSSSAVAAPGKNCGLPSRTSSAHSKKSSQPTTPRGASGGGGGRHHSSAPRTPRTPRTPQGQSRLCNGQPLRSPTGGKPSTPRARREAEKVKNSPRGRSNTAAYGAAGSIRQGRPAAKTPADGESGGSGGSGRCSATAPSSSSQPAEIRRRSGSQTLSSGTAAATTAEPTRTTFRRQPTTPRGRVNSQPASGHASRTSSVGSMPLPLLAAKASTAYTNTNSSRGCSSARAQAARPSLRLRPAPGSSPSAVDTPSSATQGRPSSADRRRMESSQSQSSLQNSVRRETSDASTCKLPAQRTPRVSEPLSRNTGSSATAMGASKLSSSAGARPHVHQVGPGCHTNEDKGESELKQDSKNAEVAAAITRRQQPREIRGVREVRQTTVIDTTERAVSQSLLMTPRTTAVATAASGVSTREGTATGGSTSQTHVQRPLQTRMALRASTSAHSTISRRAPPAVAAEKTTASAPSSTTANTNTAHTDPLQPLCGNGSGGGDHEASHSLPSSAMAVSVLNMSWAHPERDEHHATSGMASGASGENGLQSTTPLTANSAGGSGAQAGTPRHQRTDSGVGAASPRPDDYASPERARGITDSHTSSQMHSPSSPVPAVGSARGASPRLIPAAVMVNACAKPRAAVAGVGNSDATPSPSLDAAPREKAPGSARKRKSVSAKEGLHSSGGGSPAADTNTAHAGSVPVVRSTTVVHTNPKMRNPSMTTLTPTAAPQLATAPKLASEPPVPTHAPRRPGAGSQVPQTVITQRIRPQEATELIAEAAGNIHSGNTNRLMVSVDVSQLRAIPQPEPRTSANNSLRSSRVLEDRMTMTSTSMNATTGATSISHCEAAEEVPSAAQKKETRPSATTAMRKSTSRSTMNTVATAASVSLEEPFRVSGLLMHGGMEDEDSRDDVILGGAGEPAPVPSTQSTAAAKKENTHSCVAPGTAKPDGEALCGCSGSLSSTNPPVVMQKHVVRPTRKHAARHEKYIVERCTTQGSATTPSPALNDTAAAVSPTSSEGAATVSARFAALVKDSKPFRATPRGAGVSSSSCAGAGGPQLNASAASVSAGNGSAYAISTEATGAADTAREVGARHAPRRDGRTLRRLPENPRGSAQAESKGGLDPSLEIIGAAQNGTGSPPPPSLAKLSRQ